MSHSLDSVSLNIILQQDTDIIILIHDVISQVVSLGLKKVAGLEYLGHKIISRGELWLCRAIVIDIIMGRLSVGGSSTKWYHLTTMAPRVLMDSKVSINPPFDDMTIVGSEREQEVLGGLDMMHGITEIVPAVNVRRLHSGSEE